MQMLPAVVRDAAADALRNAFDQGFGAAAFTAAGVALVALVMTRLLMPTLSEAQTRHDSAVLAVPGE